jgi:hypothetical protein
MSVNSSYTGESSPHLQESPYLGYVRSRGSSSARPSILNQGAYAVVCPAPPGAIVRRTRRPGDGDRLICGQDRLPC